MPYMPATHSDKLRAAIPLPTEPRSNANQRGYNARWQRTRLYYLKKNPLCCYCLNKGVTTRATVVDHIIPHRGNQILFWDKSNWQALCKNCHDSTKKREEQGEVG